MNHLAAWKNLRFYLNCPTSPTSFDVFVNQTDFTIAVTWIQLKNLAAIIKVWFYMTWWGIENKGKNIIWWSLALLSFSWDRSLLLTKSWYSRSCFSGRSRGVGWVGFRSLSIRSDKFLKESFLKCGITYYFLTNIFTWPESFLCLYMLGSNIEKSSFIFLSQRMLPLSPSLCQIPGSVPMFGQYLGHLLHLNQYLNQPMRVCHH